MENASELEKSALQRKARLQALKNKAKSSEEKVILGANRLSGAGNM